VRDVAWLDDGRPGIDFLIRRIADSGSDTPGEDERELVLLGMLMRFDERSWGIVTSRTAAPPSVFAPSSLYRNSTR
jgi:hypothetical protein